MRKSLVALGIAGAFLVGGVVSPPVVSAVGGSLVTLVDSATSNTAKIDNIGSLQVRPVQDSALSLNQNVDATGPASASWQQFYMPWPGVTRRIGITHVTAANPVGAPMRVTVELRTRTSGTNTCANPTTGFFVVKVRTLVIPATSTVDIDLGNAPVFSSGQPNALNCIGYQVLMNQSWRLYLGVSGYAL
ncbi:hypothetical protein [Nocardioides stalactiti]|uniref:hypothetical protein n=1 Tax=Nocardioides stalactiti TaxID=2755356 RepID=UPI0016034785|nr:hypothetical protein [Nocardioides stalactiti]